jgi:CheY-like chemotaxis protein
MKGASVLIVDDDDSVRDLFTRALAGQGFVVRSAASGEEALQLIAHDLPRLIVLDLMMPGINGIEVLAAIRRRPQTAALPVLVTTATATRAYDLRDYPPVRVLRKPFELARLVRAAREMLGGGGEDS